MWCIEHLGYLLGSKSRLIIGQTIEKLFGKGGMGGGLEHLSHVLGSKEGGRDGWGFLSIFYTFGDENNK